MFGFLRFIPQLAPVIRSLYSELHVNPSCLPHCAHPCVLGGLEGILGDVARDPSPICHSAPWGLANKQQIRATLGMQKYPAGKFDRFFSVILFFPEPDSDSPCILPSLHILLLSPLLGPLLPLGRVTGQGPGTPSRPSPPVCSGHNHLSALLQPASDKLKES